MWVEGTTGPFGGYVLKSPCSKQHRNQIAPVLQVKRSTGAHMLSQEKQSWKLFAELASREPDSGEAQASQCSTKQRSRRDMLVVLDSDLRP
jgi:hypothetical protein